jgi:hypothetical protein
LGYGIISTPQAISRFGEGTARYYYDPRWENLGGVFADVSIGASVLAMGMSGLPSAKVPLGTKNVSLYEDVTLPGSRYANRAADVTKAQFERNLLDSGFTRTVSKDGKAIILEKNGARYILRDAAKSTGGPTADFYKADSQSIDLKIRLDQVAP